MTQQASSSSAPQPLASKFFIFMGFMVLCQQAAVSLAQAVSALCRDVDTSGGFAAPRSTGFFGQGFALKVAAAAGLRRRCMPLQ